MLSHKIVEGLLEQVRKPGRYLGNEWNVVKKDLTKIPVRFVLAFPDLYELGMSYLGYKILYHLLNEQQDIACERVFAPGRDLEGLLRREKIPIFTLESKEELMNFDIVGFSLTYELNYTNLLNILDLAGIPLNSDQRDDSHPLIIGGGPLSFNPEPVSAFFDCFLIGEAEDAIFEVIRIVKHFKAQPGYKREGLLKALSRIKGIYVPSLYKEEYDHEGNFKRLDPVTDGLPIKIDKNRVEDLDNTYFPTKQIVPHISIVHDRVSIEIMRGCPNLCRFCQARNLYHHKRQRSTKKILALARESIRQTGYEELSLLSLSTGNHTDIINILSSLIQEFKAKGVNVSLPSLRIDKALKEFPAILCKVKKSGLTFAPEAGTPRLREVINKEIDMRELLECIEVAYNCGWRRIKLYFMIGLPTETDEDLDGIIEIVRSIHSSMRRVELNISISSFIPKPHTPFQWEPMESKEGLERKISYIRDRIGRKGVRLSFHDTRTSLLEGALSRGDRGLSRVILEAFKNGCRFDSWTNEMDFDAWMEAFKSTGVEIGHYLYKRIDYDQGLPWGHIDCGISSQLLSKEAASLGTYLTNSS